MNDHELCIEGITNLQGINTVEEKKTLGRQLHEKNGCCFFHFQNLKTNSRNRQTQKWKIVQYGKSKTSQTQKQKNVFCHPCFQTLSQR